MRRVFEKLRGLYHRKVTKRFAWLRFFLMMLALGSVLAAMLHQALTAADIRSAQRAMNESFEFVKAQLVRYNSYVSADKAKSLVRLMDKTAEAARVLRDEPGTGAEELAEYARQQRISGLLVLDEQLQPELELMPDDDARAMCMAIIDNKNVADIRDYPVKSYLTRVRENGRSYDVAVVARQDRRGVVLAYVEKNDITDEGSELTLENLFTGFQFDMKGVAVVLGEDRVAATNAPALVGLTREGALALSDKYAPYGADGLYSVSRGNKTWLGGKCRSGDYTIYVFFPEEVVFGTRTMIVGATMALFVLIWMGFVMLRSISEHAILEQSQKRLNIINALGKAYTSIYVVRVPCGKIEVVLDPRDGLILGNDDVEDNIHNDQERYIAPEYREEIRAFLDMSTLEARLRGQRSIGYTYRACSGRWYRSGLIEKNRDKKGNLTEVLIATRDCTAEKERELEQQRQLRDAVVQARRADAAKTDFLRRMSHDIRTPINGIRGMVEIARHYGGNEAKQEECREKIMAASGFLLELVNNVLDMNKLESGEVQLEAKTFCVCDLVEESVAMVEAQTAEKALTLHRDIRCDRSDRAIGSPLHVRQVLQNLLSNAVRYNRVGGEIFLSARETARTEETVAYEFVVRDTGVGMSEAFQQRAFEPFAQEDAGARSSYTGTGLGLAIVKELVEKMGGTIRLESRKGAGTTFTVCLTFTRDRQAQRDEDAAAVPVSIRGVNVLLAEDNEINMEIAEFMLANEGAAIRKAVNGQQAVEMFSASESGEIDVILMDVMMPVMDGLEATRRIRGLNRPDARTVPIFAMTANAFADDVERSRSAGMNEHLTKPIDAAVLTRTIARYVRGREASP